MTNLTGKGPPSAPPPSRTKCPLCQAPATQAEVNRHLDHGCPDPPLIHLDDSSDEKPEKKEANDTKNQGGVVQEKGNAGQASNI